MPQRSALLGAILLLPFLVFFPAVLPAATAWERTYLLEYGGGTAWVCRDHYGTPHIYATTRAALWYANGYATAEDRLWQLDHYRHDAKGTLAALYGASQIPHDEQMRREGYTEAERQAQFEALPLDFRSILEAYRDGINARMAEVLADPDNLGPKEFWDLGHIPEPWTVTDSIAIAQMTGRRFGAAGGEELNNQAYLNANGWEAFNAWFPINDPAATVTIPDAEAPPPPSRAKARVGAARPPNDFPDLDPAVLAALRLREAAFWENLERLGLPTRLGSFAAVVAPGKSATGIPMLLGAPQMGYTEPQIANEADLHCPDLEVAGMQFAGVPSILIGRNRYLAWTNTSGHSDNVDIVVETLNPANQYQYWYNGAWRAMDRRTETIEVAGGSPVAYEVCRTVHGPVIGWDLTSNHAFSLHATFWNDELTSAFLGCNQAHDLAEFEAAMGAVVFSLNFLCADRLGNIGYWHTGRYRYPGAGVDVRLPMSGEGTQEWTGFWPFADLPHLTNPAQGYLANWNNKPVWWWDHGDKRSWIGWNHAQLIMDLVGPDPAVTFAEMEDVPYHIDSKGTYMQIVSVGNDLALPAVNILPPGQSGFISKTGAYDPHFFDQKDAYFAWDYKPFLFVPPERVAMDFAFDAVTGVQGVDPSHPLPFPVRIECRNPLGQVATAYTGPATLVVPAGYSISPASITFAGGVWSGEIRLYGVPAPVSVTASDSYWEAQGTTGSLAVAGKCDANADGLVNVLDVLRTVNLALGNAVPIPPAPAFQQWAGDANSDASVNVLDVVLVVNRSLAPTPVPARARRTAHSPVRVALVRQGGAWLLRAEEAGGVAGVQVDLTCQGAPAVSGPAGWAARSARTGATLRVIAYSPTATGLAAGERVLLRLEGAKGRPRLRQVILADAGGAAISVRGD